MMSGHLSDEAVAAFADGVLVGHARGRATRHTAECAECATAVRVQREAVFALRAAPAPALPTDLLDRLRGLPQVTPVHLPPTVVMPDGSTMLSTAAGRIAPMAALVPTSAAPAAPRTHRFNPFATTAAAVALAGALATGALVAGSDEPTPPGTDNTTVRTVEHRSDPDGAAEPASTWLRTDVFNRGGH